MRIVLPYFLMDESGRRAAAKERWRILGNALRGKGGTDAASSASVRRFSTFGLFLKEAVITPANNVEHSWFTYRWNYGQAPNLKMR